MPSPVCCSQILKRCYFAFITFTRISKEDQLGEIVEDLKHVLEFPKGGDIPIHSQESRWIDHKRKALQRVFDRYGAYIAHLTTLAEDHKVKPDDRAKLKGYLKKKWMQFRIIFGCALYVDVLKPPSLLSQCLQSSELDIVLAMKSILKSASALSSLAGLDPIEWQTECLLLKRIKNVGMDKSYQGSILKDFTQSFGRNVHKLHYMI